jgi:hypothetical protein
VRDAFSRCGDITSRSRSEARRAGLISRVAISSVNRSSASSIAAASRLRTTAVSSAVRFGSADRSSVWAFEASPYRARVVSRFTGTRVRFTRPSWNAEISFTRSSARAIAVPVVRVGGRRSRSSSLHAQGVLDAQLLGQVVHHRPRHVQRVRQEQPHVPDGADLQGEAEAVVVPAPLRDQQAVLVIEEEESLQLRAGRHLFEGAVGRGLIIS